MTTNDRRTALTSLAAAGALWGLTVPLSKLALESLGGAWLAAGRFAIAAPLLALAARRGLRSAATPTVAGAGALGYGLVILLQNAGIARTSVTHAALIVGAVPALVALIAVAIGRGSAGPRAWLGFALALAGVGLVAGGGARGDATAAGDALVALSVALSAAFIVAQPRLLAGRDPAAVTAVQMAGGAAAAVIAAPLLEGVPPALPSTAGLAALLALALVGTLVPFALFARGQARVEPELAGAFLNLEPLVGAAVGAAAFHDAFGGVAQAGAAAIVAGIALSARPPRRNGSGTARRTAAGVARTAGRLPTPSARRGCGGTVHLSPTRHEKGKECPPASSRSTTLPLTTPSASATPAASAGRADLPGRRPAAALSSGGPSDPRGPRPPARPPRPLARRRPARPPPPPGGGPARGRPAPAASPAVL